MMKTAPKSELVVALRQGSQGRSAQAFDALYALYSARLMRFVVHLTRHPGQAQDLFQEAWLKLVRSPPELNSDDDVLPWLLRVARNDWISRTRRDRRWGPLAEPELHEDPAPDPEQRLQGVQVHTHLSAALGRLSETDREVLLLVGVEGLSHEQAAQVLALSAVALRQRLSRARARLQAELGMEAQSTTPARLQVVKGGSR